MMRSEDVIRLASGAVFHHRTRSALTALGIAIGIAAVTLLTALGEGLHRFVLAEFSQFGTNLLEITPGARSTFGMSGAMINTVRPLSLDDAVALQRVPAIVATAPMVMGNAAVEWRGRSRRTAVYGVGDRMPEVWRFELGAGRFLPAESGTPRAFVVLGTKVAHELFGDANPLGEIVRIGGDRYRAIGVMRAKGQFLGFDLDDAVYVPAWRGLELFDREGLMEIDVLFRAGTAVDNVVADVRRVLVARHGREDFTIVAQQQMLDVLGSVLSVLTLAVAALGSISLVVGAVGILTIMTIAIRERTQEIGLLRALGATKTQLLRLFLTEAAALAAVGGLGGLALGLGIAAALGAAIPALPVHPSLPYALLAESVAIAIGLLAGTAPAMRAARMDPVEALRAE